MRAKPLFLIKSTVMDALSTIFSTIFMEEPKVKTNVKEKSNVKTKSVITPKSDEFKLNAVTLSSTNIVLYNPLDNGLYSLLKIILGRISRLQGIESRYSPKVSADNVSIKRFNEIFIDNPNLYFTEFGNDSGDITRVRVSSKYVDTDDTIIFATTNTRVARDIYNELKVNGKPVILLYNRDSCVNFQSKFYNSILSKIDTGLSRQEFMKMLNDENEATEIVLVRDSKASFL